MRATRNRKTTSSRNRKAAKSTSVGKVKNARVEAVRPGAKLSPLATLALGVGAYLLLAVVVEAGVIRKPEGNPALQTALLTLLSLASVAAADGFLGLIRAVSPQEMLGWPFRAAAVGSVAYSVAYGDRVFVNYWNYDDWGYLVPGPPNITQPLNDHFVPLFKIVVWGMRSVFGFDYIGAACLQQAAFLVIVLVLAHLLWSGTRRPWILILLVGLFAMWPGYGAARTWFGGGVWLTASAALLSVYVLHTRGIIFAETMRLADVAISRVLAAATVFISSQTLMPGVYVATFCAPAALWPQRRNALRRLGLLCAISLAPTAAALWGRSVYVVRSPLNPSGLFDGHLFSNLAIFILNKAFFVNSFTSLPRIEPYLYLVWLVILAAAGKKLASKDIDAGRRADLAGLILGGYAVFVLPLVQIGLGRRWNYDAVLNPYYVTLPFLGLWLASAGIGLTLLARRKDGGAARFTSGVALAVATVLPATGLSRSLHRDQPSLAQRSHLTPIQPQVQVAP